MSYRKVLITLSLLALLAIAAAAQDQNSQSSSAPAQSSPPATASGQATQAPATPNQTSTAPTQTTPSQTPPEQTPPAQSAPAQSPSAQAPPAQPSTGATPAPPADNSGADSSKDSSNNASDASNPQTPPPVQEPDASKVKHDGGEDDVDAIGNRKIGGRGIGDWYSLETEIKIGKQYSMQVENSVKMVQDPVVNEYVNRIGQNLVRNSDAKVPFTIKVIDSDEINAFALPGGFFYVNSGLILAADEEAELAGVMAHEISHVCARHQMRQLTRANMAQLGTLPLIFVGGGIGYGIYQAAGLGLPLTFMKFQRNFEAEADYLGVQYMYKTGYDPQAFVSFFEKIQAKEKKKPGSISKAFASHPQTPDRIEATQKEIATILPAKAAVHCFHLGVRRCEIAAGDDRKPPQGARAERLEQTHAAPDFDERQIGRFRQHHRRR